MRQPLLAAVVAFVLCAPAPLAAAAAPAPTPAPAGPQGQPIVIGTSHRLASAILGGEREINVRLPDGYAQSPDRRYPVLYVLDGGADQDFPHIAALGQLADISWTFDHMIVVGVGTKVRAWELTPPTADERYIAFNRKNGLAPDRAAGGGAEAFRRHIAEEVMPFVDKAYRTSGRRTVIGESLAGLFVVDTLLHQPRLFDDYIAVSPSLWWDREALPNTAAGLLEAGDYKGRRLYLTKGNEGGTMQRGTRTLLAALRSPAAGALQWIWVDRQNAEHHGSIYHPAALDALRTLYPQPWQPGLPTPWLDIGPTEPPSEAAKALARQPCSAETARRATLAEVAADPSKWDGACILSPMGAAPEPREQSANWRQ